MTQPQGSGKLIPALSVIVMAIGFMGCCVAPLLIATGALAAIGGALCNGWVIGIAAVMALSAVTYTLYRRRGDRAPECCAPPTPARHTTPSSSSDEGTRP